MTPLDVVVMKPGVSTSTAGALFSRLKDAFPNRGANREFMFGVDG